MLGLPVGTGHLEVGRPHIEMSRANIGAICHTRNRGAVLREAFRLLKPEGQMAIIDFACGPEYFGERFWSCTWS